MSELDPGSDSIQRRISHGFFGTTGLALLLTAGSLFMAAFVQFRQTTDDQLATLARVTAANSEVTLVFHDAKAAAENLRALAAVEAIEAALIYDAEGRIFARYVRADVRSFRPPEELVFASQWRREYLDLAVPIRTGDEPIGVVYLRSDTRHVTAFLLTSIAIVVVVLLISFFLCAWGAKRLRRSIALPLEELVRGSASMAAGDLSTQVEVRSSDEVGVLAQAFNAMVLSLRGLVSQVRQNARSVSQAMGQLTGASTAMREESIRQERAVAIAADSVGRIVSSMHAVNQSVEALTEIALESSSAAVEMDSSIAETGTHIDELSEIIEITASSVVEMTSAIREIARSADTLNQSTVSTSQALELLSGAVRTVESNASESHSLSDVTAARAEQGMAAVHETVDGMREIKQSFQGIDAIIQRLSEKSESIGEVVKVIESVVEQTNLLALNAAIISSQAGEHGRAFSVVADEVRSLAERTAASTREIVELIDSVQGGVSDAVRAMEQGATRVERGVELSSEAGRILREIGEGTQRSTRWAKEILEATRSQAADIDQVSVAMTQVKEIAMQLNRGTHEQDSASSEITRGVEQMRHLGLEVQNSAQEQRRESGLITRSVEAVAAKIKAISVETREQSEQADQIQAALAVFREVTVESSRRAEQTSETIADVAAHTRGLEEEVGRFRI